MTNGGICKITLFLYIQLPFISAEVLLPNGPVSLRYYAPLHGQFIPHKLQDSFALFFFALLVAVCSTLLSRRSIVVQASFQF